MRQEFIGDLSADVLLGASAPLYTKLYDKGLVESSFSAGYEGLRGVSMFTAGGDSREPEAVVDAILSEAERVAKEGVAPVLFERIKKSTVGHRLRDLDGFETTCYRTCSYFFDGAEYFDFLRVMQSVTAEDVQSYLSRCLQREKAAVSVIRPKR